jgi:hypothetical protein
MPDGPYVGSRVTELSLEDLRRRGYQPRLVGPDQVAVGSNDTLGLTNLRQVCSQHPEAEWRALVAQHFDSVFAVGVQGVDPDWALARPNLRIRVYPPESVVAPDQSFVWQLAPDLFAVLVYDLPETLFNVTQEAARPWGQDRDALWRTGLENMNLEPRPKVTNIGNDATPVLAIEGESYYTATNVLWLDRFMYLDPGLGAVVGVPSRHLLVAHPLRNLGAAVAINQIMAGVSGIFDAGPGSITPNLYWWRRGSLTHLPSDRRARTFTPPAEFVQLLNSLPPAP